MKTKTLAELLRLSRITTWELKGLWSLADKQGIEEQSCKPLLTKKLIRVTDNGYVITPKGWRKFYQVLSATFELIFRAQYSSNPDKKYMFSKQGFYMWLNIYGYYMTKCEMNGVKVDVE